MVFFSLCLRSLSVVQIIALDTFISVSCNTEVLMTERLAFASNFLVYFGNKHIVSITWLLIFLENFLSPLHRILSLNFPFTNSARPLAIGGPVSCEQFRKELIADNN